MADLTIKFKGQPIVEMTESGTKTLKTAGKYCEGDITVEYAKPAGGGGSGFAETILTDVMENHFASSRWSPSVTAEELIPKKYYYNGVLLPEIPESIFADYPYRAVIRYANGNAHIIGSVNGFYFNGTSAIYDKNNTVLCAYKLSNNMWVEDTEQNKKYTGWTSVSNGASMLLWSSHDIVNGSATATAVYFEATPLVPESPLPRYSYNGHMLPAIPAELLELYPYAFIYKNATWCSLVLSCVPYSYCEATDTTTERLAATNADGCIKNYRFPVEYEQEIVYWPHRNNSWYYWESPQNLLWSNYNILNETTGEVYFNGSEPVLAE